MKKFLLILATIALFASCQTEMSLENPEDSIQLESNFTVPNMEFIGFKGQGSFGQVTQSDIDGIIGSSALKNLGGNLQYAGIASDMSDAYFGIYSLQELETYKNKKRYVTFVDMSDFKLTYKDVTNYGVQLTGAFLTGLIVTAPIGAVMMLAAPYKTEMHLVGTCRIFVYDCNTNTVIGTENIVVNQTDTFKGLWPRTSSDGRSAIYENYGVILSNAILEKYSKIKTVLGL